MRFIILALLLALLTCQQISDNQFVYLNPGQGSIVSVAPLNVTQVSSSTNFSGAASGFRYNWSNLPSWATANGSSFYGVIPSGQRGIVPVTVTYTDQNGNTGNFTFELNYAGTGLSASTSAAAGGSSSGGFTIISGVNSAGLTVPTSVNSQLVLIPGPVSSYQNITTTINATATVTTAGSGAACVGVINNLNQANDRLDRNMNSYLALN